MSNTACQTCHRPRGILVALGKLNLVQGYEQCADCRSDLEHESVIIRDVYFKKAEEEAKENGEKYSFQYLPEWLQKDIREGQEKINKMFRNLDECYKDYTEIID